MKITIIDGTLDQYNANEESGSVSVEKVDLEEAIALAVSMLAFGKSIVIEPDKEGE